jgi:hypothetical protein
MIPPVKNAKGNICKNIGKIITEIAVENPRLIRNIIL